MRTSFSSTQVSKPNPPGQRRRSLICHRTTSRHRPPPILLQHLHDEFDELNLILPGDRTLAEQAEGLHRCIAVQAVAAFRIINQHTDKSGEPYQSLRSSREALVSSPGKWLNGTSAVVEDSAPFASGGDNQWAEISEFFLFIHAPKTFFRRTSPLPPTRTSLMAPTP